MSYKCEYCNSVLGSVRALKLHQKITKKCLSIRGICDYEFKCVCGGEFARKVRYEEHKLQCIPFIQDKYTKMIEEKDKMIEEKDKMIEEKEKKVKEEKDKVINKLEKEIKKLNKRATSITNNNKITINNNLINLNIPANLSQTAIQEICKQFLNQKTVNDGYKSMAKFLVKYIIMDKDGKVNVLCTDVNRKVFKYRDEDGRLLKDVRGFILKKKIRKGSIQEINKIAGGLIGNLDPEDDTFIIEADRINSSRDYEKLVKELSVLLYEKSLTVDDLKKELPPKIEEKKLLIENEDSDDEEIVKQYWNGDEEEEILDEETMKEINEKVHDFYTREIHEIGKECDDNSKSISPQKKVLSKKNKKDEKDDEVLVIKLKEWKEEKSIDDEEEENDEEKEEEEEEDKNEEEEMTNEERIQITSKLMGWSSLPLTKEDKIKLKKFYNEKSIKEQMDIEYPSNQESEDDRTPRTKKRLQEELDEDNGPYGYGPVQISYNLNNWN